MKFDVVIVGAGLAGVTLAKRVLSARPNARIVIADEAGLGGKLRSIKSRGNWFDVGGHFLHSFEAIPEEFRPSNMDNWPLRDKATFSIDRDGKMWEGPIQRYFPAASGPIDESSFRRFFVSKFGDELADLFFIPYNAKMLGGEQTMDRFAPSTLQNVRSPAPTERGYNDKFRYPVAGGIQAWFDELWDSISDSVVFVRDCVSVLRVTPTDWGLVGSSGIFATAPIAALSCPYSRKRSPTVHVFNGYGIPKFQHPENWSWGYFADSSPFFRIGTYECCGAKKVDGLTPFYAETTMKPDRFLIPTMFDSAVVVSHEVVRNAYPLYGYGEEQEEDARREDSKKSGLFWIGRYGKNKWFSMMETVLDTIKIADEVIFSL